MLIRLNRIKEWIDSKLESEGWKDKIRRKCLDYTIKKGNTNVTFEEFNNEYLNYAMSM